MKHSSASHFQPQILKATDSARDKLQMALRILDGVSVPEQQPEPASESRPVTEQELRLMLRARRNRARFFDGDLFADPAWDMLLELYAAELGQRRLAVTSLCIGSGVPATTALRWIRTLENKGLLVRSADPRDGRRVFVSLSETAVRSMSAYFQQQQQQSSPLFS